jgi:AbrB family looped-hinge helix DNA binding protein
MRITSKGQVTIPLAIRQKAGLTPHTEVEFKFENGRVEIVKAKDSKRLSKGEIIVERLRGIAKTGLTTDQIMEMTRGYEPPAAQVRRKKRA